jgi:tetrapyrrole methylase family protein / MazG family protein
LPFSQLNVNGKAAWFLMHTHVACRRDGMIVDQVPAFVYEIPISYFYNFIRNSNIMDAFDRLIDIMDRLRGPGGCPWDAEQDHKSIMKHLIEETYELAEAVDSGDPHAMLEELGDVLLHVVFHSVIARDKGEFALAEVIDHLCEKLIYRHPHVFGDTTVADSKEVIRNWEKLKGAEAGKRDRPSILSDIPVDLPALLRAMKIQSKVSRVGFDWEGPEGVIDKLNEETRELAEAMDSGDRDRIEDEIGDLIFSAVNMARLLKVDPEAALRRTCAKFIHRFQEIENVAREKGVGLADMPMAEKDRIWEAAKEK